MRLPTNWGYTLLNGDLDNILTPSEFDAFTNDKWRDDGRITPNLQAASAAARNYCGWHIYPSLQCEVQHTLEDFGFIKTYGRDILVQLPARYVSEVSEVLIDATYENETWTGTACDFSFDTNGLVRIYDVHPYQYSRKTKLVVRYTAGLPDELAGSIKELIAQSATHAMAATYGVNSETSGGVSITYNNHWATNGNATALADNNKETLEPFRLKGVY